MQMRKIIVLFSGGIESTSLLAHYLLKGYLVYPLYVKFGYDWEKEELKCAKKVHLYMKKRFKNIMPLKVLKANARIKNIKKSNVEIPLRNLILCTCGAVYGSKKGIYAISLGSLGSFPFKDNKYEYFKTLEKLISEGLNGEFKIELPFFGLHKDEVLKRYGKYIPLELTISCLFPVNGKPCGSCEKCKEREEAIKKLTLQV